MKKLIRFLIEALQELEKLDKAKFAKEVGELFYSINKYAFSQIPGISAIAGILVGAWVASTFTTSQFKGFLASWGIIKGGRHVVSSTTYGFLSIALPIVGAALTAYIVQKGMKAYRAKQFKRNMERIAQSGEKVQLEVQAKLDILEKAKEAGLVSTGEYFTKKANLFQSYSKTTYPFKFQELIIEKLTS